MLNSRAELRETLRDVLLIEVKARDNYQQDVATFRNVRITKLIEQIRKDEEKHILWLGELIAMLEKEQ